MAKRMLENEYDYEDYVLKAYKKALRVINSNILDDIDFKDIKNNEDKKEKMTLILFQDILRKYEEKGLDW